MRLNFFVFLFFDRLILILILFCFYSGHFTSTGSNCSLSEASGLSINCYGLLNMFYWFE